MTVKLVSVTPDAEQTMAYIARVSNPSNQNNEKYAGLLKYCIKHNHLSCDGTSGLNLQSHRALFEDRPMVVFDAILQQTCILFIILI